MLDTFCFIKTNKDFVRERIGNREGSTTVKYNLSTNWTSFELRTLRFGHQAESAESVLKTALRYYRSSSMPLVFP